MSTSAECRRQSYRRVEKHKTYKRVMLLLDELGAMTAEETAEAMYARYGFGMGTRGDIAPRLTELDKEKGVVVQCGVKIASAGRPVTIYAAKEGWQNLLAD